MSVPSPQQTLLLIEPHADLRELEQLILTDAGYVVELLPPDAPPVTYAAQHRPDIIVIHLAPGPGDPLALVDQLNAQPSTQAIPVVVIARTETMAAMAQASANVDMAVVAPYDVAALEDAVATALGHPPPAAVLPDRASLQSAGVRAVATVLAEETRPIVLQTIQQLRQLEMYQTRFDELSRGLVDELGTLIGAIAMGIARGLTPREVFASDVIARDIQEHVHLRRTQGLGLAAAVRELRALALQIDAFLPGLVPSATFTADDVTAAQQLVHAYIDELVLTIVVDYATDRADQGA